MPTLSDRLKAMGLKIGTKEISPPIPSNAYPVEEVVAGRFIDTKNGSTYVIEKDFPEDYLHGQVKLQITEKPQTVAEWAGMAKIADQSPEDFMFLDTETSGLAGGTGTFAFLIGAGRFTKNGFHLAQFFMRDPIEEAALLLALEEFLGNCQTIVSFNGKAFDVPLLDSRYTLQGWISPFKNLAHVDLLHLSRRLWRDRLPSRTLANLEVQILHASRTEDEIPGWMIPQIYFDYLRDGDARPLRRVFYHNSMDVISLAALLNHTSLLLENPRSQISEDMTDLAAIARLLEDLGHMEKATDLYEVCLNVDLPEEIHDDTLLRLSMLHKRNGDYLAALPLWEQATSRHHLYAYEELAKYYEHHSSNLELALKWTNRALEYIEKANPPSPELQYWRNEFKHRQERLQRKFANQDE